MMAKAPVDIIGKSKKKIQQRSHLLLRFLVALLALLVWSVGNLMQSYITSRMQAQKIVQKSWGEMMMREEDHVAPVDSSQGNKEEDPITPTAKVTDPRSISVATETVKSVKKEIRTEKRQEETEKHPTATNVTRTSTTQLLHSPVCNPTFLSISQQEEEYQQGLPLPVLHQPKSNTSITRFYLAHIRKAGGSSLH